MNAISTVEAIAGLLLVAAATRAMARHIRWLPFPIALVIMGVALSGLGGLNVPFLSTVAQLRISPEIAFFVFLPILVFESAFNMDVRDLRENLSPVLTLAVPGLIMSTALTGILLHYSAPLVGISLNWPAALLLGSILSATDPVGVTTLFRQIGAPRRLSVLVEGESLFNDATAIVTSRILQGILLVGATVSTAVIVEGILDFFIIFVGGLAVGWLSTILVGMILGWVDSDAFIEISITTVLAYLAFILAEESLAVSGVMATVAAGLLLGGWGKTKISPSVKLQLEQYWAFLAAVANSMVFLMVGLRVDLGALQSVLPMLALAVLAMLLSRAASIYMLVPLIGRLPGAEPIGRRYQTVMWWGGLRGGIALAIALSLPAEIPLRDELFIPLAMGAVLFTLLVQGLTIEPLVRRLKLHIPSLSDQVARVEGLISAKRRTLTQVPELAAGGLFSPRIAESVQNRCAEELQRLRGELEELRRRRELDPLEERRLLYLRVFAVEKDLFYKMFSRSHVSEGAYRKVTHSIELQTEAIRHAGRIPEFTLHPPTGERVEIVLLRLLDGIPGISALAEQRRAARTAQDYEIAWARSRGSRRVLDELDEIGLADATLADVVEEVRAYYQYWQENARSRLDQTAEQFPEFVASTQDRLAERLVLHAEREAIEEKAHSGIIPEGVADHMLKGMAADLRRLRSSQTSKLRIDPGELLRKVPFFQGLPEDEFARIARKLKRRTSPSGEMIVRQGASGDSLYLVARGVIRVSRHDGGLHRDLATLMAGDFFGEMALIAGGHRTATCRAVTPCALYELRRADLDDVLSATPAMRAALEEASRTRRAEQLTSSEKTGISAPALDREADES